MNFISVHGEFLDCKYLSDNYTDCKLGTGKNNDEEAVKRVIAREKERVEKRLADHKNNDVWERRTSPPENWNTPLPFKLKKMNEESLFKEYQDNLGAKTEESWWKKNFGF